MTLRRKTILILSITLAGLIILLYLLLRTITLSSYNALEQQGVLRNLARATNSFEDDINRLQGALLDWSNWDDAYTFVQDRNTSYIASNLTDDTFLTLKINAMMFVNGADEVVYSKVVDLDQAAQAQLEAAVEAMAPGDDRFLRLTTSTPTAGFVLLAGEPMLIASRPILHSDKTGPSGGTLIWVRHLDEQALAAMSTSLRLTVALRGVDDAGMPSDMLDAKAWLSPASPQFISRMSDDIVHGYALLSDIYGEPSLILSTLQDREIYRQGQTSLTYFVAALIIVGVVFGAGTLLLLERLILSPLAHLNARVRHVGISDDFSMRLPVDGHDELAQLAIAINTMLNTVAQSRSALQRLNTELERRVAERTTELEDQKSQLQAIMDTMGEGLVYCVDGLIKYVNGTFVDLLDYPVRDLVGKPFHSLTSETDGDPDARRYQTALTRHDGTLVNVAITSMPVDEFDDRQRSVIIVRDITQELAAKQQKDYFFARASHDLRSPLTSIMTRLYLLGKKPEQLETHLKILNSVSNRMLELVNDLLDVSRVEQGALVLNRRDLVLQNIVDEVIDVQQADAALQNIHLNAELVETPLHVYGDPLRLNQVITNLVSNAIHYTPESGRITVTVEKECRGGARCAAVHVSDNGIGISTDNLAHIFDPFFRVNSDSENGSGLGLYIVKQIVELHGGEVSVASEVGKGTTFSVYLVLSEDRLGEDEPQTRAQVTPE